jgi:hypothetical protein
MIYFGGLERGVLQTPIALKDKVNIGAEEE